MKATAVTARRWGVCLAWTLAVLAAADACGQATAPEGDLLDAVLRDQTEARAKAQNVAARVNIEGESVTVNDGHDPKLPPEMKVKLRADMRLTCVGERKRIDAQYQSDLPQGGDTGVTERHFVLNENYAAVWDRGGFSVFPYLTVNEHHSADAVTPSGELAVAAAEPENVFRMAFGCARSLSLEQAVAHWKSLGRVVKAVRAEKEGSAIFRVEGYMAADAPKPALVFVVDPEKGFLVTEAHIDDPQWCKLDQTLEALEVAPGRWFPVKIEYRAVSAGDPSWRTEDKVKVVISEVVFDPPADSGFFTWQALGYPGTDAILFTPEGVERKCRVKGDQLVPSGD